MTYNSEVIGGNGRLLVSQGKRSRGEDMHWLPNFEERDVFKCHRDVKRIRPVLSNLEEIITSAEFY